LVARDANWVSTAFGSATVAWPSTGVRECHRHMALRKGLEMNSTIAQQGDHVLRLTDIEIGSLLSTTSGMVVVQVTTEWCLPCRLLRPLMRKLAMEFASRMMLVELDGDSAQLFKRVHHVDTFPHLYFFERGQLVGREVGFRGADEIRAAVEKRLNVTGAESPTEAELSFREAFAQATARLEEIMKPVSVALEPHIAAIAPIIEAFQAALIEEVAAGRISQLEIDARRKAEQDRLCASFQDEIAALRAAQHEALVAYDELMSEALEHFATAGQLSKPPLSTIALSCRAPLPFCSSAVLNRHELKSLTPSVD
jgi:thioredoxin 1